MSRLIVHAGTGKTGTSAIQASILKNEQALSAQGYRFPKSNRPRPQHLAKHQFQWRERESPHWDELRNEASALARECEHLIVSDEVLWQKRPKELRFLKSFFEGYEFTVLLYVREQVDYLESRALQAAKNQKNRWTFDLRDLGNPRGLDEFLDAFLPEVDYLKVARRLEEVFGEGSVQARLYSREHFPEGNVIGDFYEAVGASTDTLDLHSEMNPRMSTPLAAIWTNRDEYLELKWSRPEIRDAALLMSSYRTPSPAKLITAQQAAEIRERFAESNRTFFSEYVVNADGFPIRDWGRGNDYDLHELASEMEEIMGTWPLIPSGRKELFTGKSMAFHEGWSIEQQSKDLRAIQESDDALLRFRLPYMARLRSGSTAFSLKVECEGDTTIRRVEVNGADRGVIDLSRETIPLPDSKNSGLDGVEIRLSRADGDAGRFIVVGLQIEEKEKTVPQGS